MVNVTCNCSAMWDFEMDCIGVDWKDRVKNWTQQDANE